MEKKHRKACLTSFDQGSQILSDFKALKIFLPWSRNENFKRKSQGFFFALIQSPLWDRIEAGANKLVRRVAPSFAEQAGGMVKTEVPEGMHH